MTIDLFVGVLADILEDKTAEPADRMAAMDRLRWLQALGA